MRQMLGSGRVAGHRHGISEEHLTDVEREFVVGIEPLNERGDTGTE